MPEGPILFPVKGNMKTYIKCVLKHNTSALAPSIQRDGMGREEGEGFRMGNTCIPVVDSF